MGRPWGHEALGETTEGEEISPRAAEEASGHADRTQLLIDMASSDREEQRKQWRDMVAEISFAQ